MSQPIKVEIVAVVVVVLVVVLVVDDVVMFICKSSGRSDISLAPTPKQETTTHPGRSPLWQLAGSL